MALNTAWIGTSINRFVSERLEQSGLHLEFSFYPLIYLDRYRAFKSTMVHHIFILPFQLSSLLFTFPFQDRERMPRDNVLDSVIDKGSTQVLLKTA